jgi:hypothetical protein
MKKKSLSLALCAALSLAVMTAAADAATKSGGKSSKSKSSTGTKVTVNAQPNTAVGYFHSCVGSSTQFWGGVPVLALIAAPVSAVGCGAVWSVPILVQAFWWRA